MSNRTLSFAHGKGDLDHNARRKNGNDRTYVTRERRVWNETLIEQNVDDVIERVYGAALRAYNEKQLAGRHPERCKTMEQWVHSQRRGAKPYTEYVVQLGDRLTGCPYEYVTDKNGNMIATDGTVILPWQTRKNPAPLIRDGKLFMSDEGIRLKSFYKVVYENWKSWNPDMIIVGAYIHADEKGGVHMHVDCICKNKANNGIGLGISVTGCLRQMLDNQGITYGKTRYDNAERTWTNLMRRRLTELAKEHGYNIVSGHCAGRKKRSTKQFIVEENIRNDVLDKMHESLIEKEHELNSWQQSLSEAAAEQDARADYINERESVISDKERAVREKEDALRAREILLSAKESRVQSNLAVIQADKNEAALKLQEVQQRNHELDRREVELQKQIKSIQHILDLVKQNHPEWLKGLMYGEYKRSSYNKIFEI